MSVPNVAVLKNELIGKKKMTQKAIDECLKKLEGPLNPADLSDTQEEMAYFSGIEEICHSILSDYFDVGE